MSQLSGDSRTLRTDNIHVLYTGSLVEHIELYFHVQSKCTDNNSCDPAQALANSFDR